MNQNEVPVQIACPHCAALNRLPAARLGESPNCGRCKRALFEAAPVVLTAQNFEAHAQRGDLPLLIDAWAGWCQPCLQMAPHFEAAAAQLEPHARLGKLDTEAEPGLAARFGIRSIPTLILMRHGGELARHSGAIPAQQIVAWTRQHLPR
jgi:thioredoxin 2